MMRISSIRPLRLKGAAPGLSSRANFGRSRKISPNGSVVRAIEVLIAVSILACAVAVIRSVSAPLPEVRAALQPAPAQTPAATVIAINPFRSAAVPDAPQTNETDAELADTTANLRLFGTWLDAEGGSAFVSGPDEKQIRVKPGDEIAPGVSLESVHREHVVILRSGVREALRLARGLDRSGAAAVPASARPTAPSGVAVPSVMRAVDNGGRGVNIVVEGGVDPQLLASLGLEAGDVIRDRQSSGSSECR